MQRGHIFKRNICYSKPKQIRFFLKFVFAQNEKHLYMYFEMEWRFVIVCVECVSFTVRNIVVNLYMWEISISTTFQLHHLIFFFSLRYLYAKFSFGLKPRLYSSLFIECIWFGWLSTFQWIKSKKKTMKKKNMLCACGHLCVCACIFAIDLNCHLEKESSCMLLNYFFDTESK